VSDDRAVVVAVASGAGAVEVRDVAELVAPLDATTPAPVRFAGARGCHLSIEGEDGGDRYEVWVADGGGAIAAIAGGSPYDTAAWREVHAIVDSIEKADA
jgi:hypothetical protein